MFSSYWHTHICILLTGNMVQRRVWRLITPAMFSWVVETESGTRSRAYVFFLITFFFFQGLVEMKTLDIFSWFVFNIFFQCLTEAFSRNAAMWLGEDVPGEMWVRPLRHWSRHHSLFAGSDFEVEISGRNNTCDSWKYRRQSDKTTIGM